jgi:hypothetical protein
MRRIKSEWDQTLYLTTQCSTVRSKTITGLNQCSRGQRSYGVTAVCVVVTLRQGAYAIVASRYTLAGNSHVAHHI